VLSRFERAGLCGMTDSVREDNMKRTCALVVIAAMISSSCAARGPAPRVDRTLATPARSLAAGPTENGATATEDPEVWRRYAARLPIGATVRVKTTGGERFTAVLLTADDAGITVKPKTRIPEPARQVSFDRLAQLELAYQGANLAKAAAVGGAVGAGVFLGLLMILFSNLD
jgi:hypothetical protein